MKHKSQKHPLRYLFYLRGSEFLGCYFKAFVVVSTAPKIYIWHNVFSVLNIELGIASKVENWCSFASRNNVNAMKTFVHIHTEWMNR